MDSAFPIFLPECMDLTPFYSAEKSHCKLSEAVGEWRLKLDKLAEGKLSWEKCFEVSANEICKQTNHPAFLVQTTKGGHTLLHVAIYQNRRDWIDCLFKIPSLSIQRNKYGLTPLELAQFLGRTGSKRLSLISTLGMIKSEHTAKIEEIEYLSLPQFESEKIFDHILEKSAKAKREDLIPAEKIWMGIYFDQEIQKGYHPKISIKWVNKKIGFGVFTEERILSCNFAGEYTGIIRERKLPHIKDNYYCIRYTPWETGFRKFVIDAKHRGNFTRFINHSETPNLGLQLIYWRGLPRLIFISLREIQKNEQLTFNYGTLFWKECTQAPIAL